VGMFDTLRSSYDLGPQFTNVELQTKDMDDFGGSMTFYHIDPEGYLWYGDYRETSTFELIEEDDPRYDPKHLFLNYEFVPTGKRGKWQVHPITKYIEIYPAQFDGPWGQWPRLRLHFKSGRLQDFGEVTVR